MIVVLLLKVCFKFIKIKIINALVKAMPLRYKWEKKIATPANPNSPLNERQENGLQLKTSRKP